MASKIHCSSWLTTLKHPSTLKTFFPSPLPFFSWKETVLRGHGSQGPTGRQFAYHRHLVGLQGQALMTTDFHWTYDWRSMNQIREHGLPSQRAHLPDCPTVIESSNLKSLCSTWPNGKIAYLQGPLKGHQGLTCFDQRQSNLSRKFAMTLQFMEPDRTGSFRLRPTSQKRTYRIGRSSVASARCESSPGTAFINPPCLSNFLPLRRRELWDRSITCDYQVLGESLPGMWARQGPPSVCEEGTVASK
ncbi:hypothetical protein V8F33_000212 [Rhypophila sp. PSN 637]